MLERHRNDFPLHVFSSEFSFLWLKDYVQIILHHMNSVMWSHPVQVWGELGCSSGVSGELIITVGPNPLFSPNWRFRVCLLPINLLIYKIRLSLSAYSGIEPRKDEGFISWLFFFLVPDPLGVFRPGALPFKAISFNQVMGLENAQVVPSPGGLWLSPCFPAVP